MNVYQKLGVEPIINACGTVTRLGGAPMPDAVLDAYREAARDWVPLEQLQAAASRRLAEVTGAEAGLVTSGAAAALTLGTAAMLCGHDPGRMERLPDCTGFPRQMVVAREQRSGYDHAVRAAGARLVEVGFNEVVANAGVRRTEVWEYESAFGPDTCGVLYVHADQSRPALSELVEVAHRHGLPVLVDAAGELPPRRRLRELIDSGADLVAFSGGKAIRGPQATGILCGRRDLVSSAALQMLDMDDHPQLWEPPEDFILRDQLRGLPRHGIGRGMKVAKESIVALLAALDLFVEGEYDKQTPRLGRYLGTILEGLRDCPAVCRIIEPDQEQRWPRLEIDVVSEDAAAAAFEICRRLRRGSPPVYVGHGKLPDGTLVVNPLCLDDRQTTELTRRLREEFARL